MSNHHFHFHLLPPWLQKVFTWLAGGTFYMIFSRFYDFVVFSFVIWKFGLVTGGIIMIFLSFFVDFGTLKLYDWMKKDWLAIETVKLAGIHHKSRVGKMINWLLKKKGILLAFLALSIKCNPFIVTAYMRRGAFKYDGMNRHDWTVFVLSSLVGDTYWVFIIYGGLSFFSYLYQSIITLFF